MKPTHQRLLAACALAGMTLALTGCNAPKRRIFVTSEPAGARVILNDVNVGVTPAEVDFTYFGTYDVRLSKPGYEPLVTQAKAEAPIHEWPLIDLGAMLVPGGTETEIRWHFVLEEATADEAGAIERARAMREALEAPEDDG